MTLGASSREAVRSDAAVGSRCRSLASALLALVLAGCSGLDPTGVAELRTVAPPEARPPIAAPAADDPEYTKFLAAYGGLYDDPGATRAVARAVGRIVAASDGPSVTYRITILNSPVVNAFALPSGHLFVTRGLLALANDTAEMAAVIAHEMAHVTARHALARQRRIEASLIANSVVANVLQDPAAQRLALAQTQLSFARFSQTQELEADAIGVKTLARAGYDPFASSRFLTSMGRFAEYRAARSTAVRPDFLSSHPATPERIAFSVRAAREIGSPGLGEQDRDAFVDGLDGLVFGDDPRDGVIRGRSFLHKGLGLTFAVPDGFLLENTQKAVLAIDQRGVALRFDGAEVEDATALGDYLRSGWINGLVRDSVRETAVGALPAATASAVADGWSFRIGVVRVGRAVYRFIFAAQEPGAEFERSFATTLESFRRVTAEEAARVRPARLRIARVRSGDTQESLAERMGGGERRLELFRILNGLGPEDSLRPGRAVKLVTD